MSRPFLFLFPLSSASLNGSLALLLPAFSTRIVNNHFIEGLDMQYWRAIERFALKMIRTCLLAESAVDRFGAGKGPIGESGRAR
jgi:hypothetical protein